ncbi:MAG TPA: PAS domain S-box protein [Xanthobacteraceae bacterium]|nr:PAS domain S-box protein [Xanthobacteraceae bacterium]
MLKDKALAQLLAAAEPFVDPARPVFALFDSAGRLLHASDMAAALFGPADTLSALSAGAHAALATLDDGEIEIPFGVLRVKLRRITARRETALLATIAAPARPAPPPEPEPARAKEAAAEPAASVAGNAEPVRAPSRPPTRFVWQTDADGRFASVSADLAAVVGVTQAELAGLDWAAAAERFAIAEADKVTATTAKRDTWSGITILWPLPDSELARPIDLAALPVFDREHSFLGYRGFGVFRELVPHVRRAPKAPAPEPVAARPKPAREPVRPEPPILQSVVAPENVVRLRPGGGELRRPSLSPSEHHAFREIARVLGARIEGVDDIPVQPIEPEEKRTAPMPRAVPTAPLREAIPHAAGNGERAVLDRLPLGVVVHRGDTILYANRTLLDWLGLDSAEALASAGGLNRLFAGGPALDPTEDTGASRVLAISGREDEPIPVEARLLTAPWEGETALVYVLRRAGAALDERLEASGLALRAAEATAREMRAVLDTATDGIIILDRQGRIHGLNRSAEALFGFDSPEVEGQSFQMLFAPESHRAAADYLDGVASGGVTSLLNDGREVIGRVREGGLIPLFMTLGRIGENAEKFCAVFRDISQWKRAEEDLIESKRQAERTSSAKSDFLAKISHEVRTPLNAIIGFAEVMMDERFGPMGNERYLQYVKDIHTSGQHLISLVNDLLDLSKIEAGKVELAFGRVDLNDVARQCMGIMQPQANRERIIIRSSLALELPEVVADARSIRQIVLNLLSNSVKFTPPGGQVIVSTMLADTGEVYLRVRDTGVGMSDADIATALEPFRQLSTVSRARGTGLGLPLTKALVEANRASFTIKSAVSSGTLVEIAFPSTRVLAE